jgi:hypothetical protein
MTTPYDEVTLLRIKELADLVYQREPSWRTTEMRLLAPATPNAIASLSEALPVPLPPSYRTFLKTYDGCIDFWPKFTLLGTTGETRQTIDAEVEDARETLAQYVAADGGQVTPERIAEFETPTEVTEQLYLPRHTVFGTNRGGEFFVFNERVCNGDEYEVVHYTYDGGIYYRYEDFGAFLRATLQSLEKRVREKKYR